MRPLVKCAGGLSLVLMVSMVAPSVGKAQIPNAGFELWNASGNPDSWSTTNNPLFGTPITPTTTRRSGSFAARGEVISASGIAWPANLIAAFVQSQVPERFQAYYQFAPQGGDGLSIVVVFYNNLGPVAAAETLIVAPSGAFTLLDLPMELFDPTAPTYCDISISIVGTGTEGQPTAGSTYILDDLSYVGSLTSVPMDKNVPKEFALGQNYPNPFNPSTTIEYSLPEAGQVRLDIFNAIGEQVATLVDERQDAGSYRARFEAAGLPSGIYLYRLSAGGSVSVKRMILMK